MSKRTSRVTVTQAARETESDESQSRDGIFKRLRRRFFSISRQLPTSSSTESAFHSVPVKVERNSIIIIQKKRAPIYQSVPLPPGCIPSDVMMIAENQHQASSSGHFGQTAAEMYGSKQMQFENQRGIETSSGAAVSAPNVQSEGCNVLPTVLHDNWVNPKF